TGRAARGVGRLYRQARPVRPGLAGPALCRRGHYPVGRGRGRAVGRRGVQGPGVHSQGVVRLRLARPGNGETVMTEPFRDLAELRALLDALCEETITAEQMRRLEELVLAHPEAEAHYVQYLSLYADLARHFAGPPVTAERALRERLGAARPGVER